MATTAILGADARLTRQEIEDTLKTWAQENYQIGDSPRLNDQQYVLFSEFKIWPPGDGWP